MWAGSGASGPVMVWKAGDRPEQLGDLTKNVKVNCGETDKNHTWALSDLKQGGGSRSEDRQSCLLLEALWASNAFSGTKGWSFSQVSQWQGEIQSQICFAGGGRQDWGWRQYQQRRSGDSCQAASWLLSSQLHIVQCRLQHIPCCHCW